MLSVSLLIALGFALTFIAWRYFWFFRDPERTPPAGDGILAPADGFVVYVHTVRAGEVPVALKGKRSIPLGELLGVDCFEGDGLLIGIFMTAFHVHVNRAPISGTVRRRAYLAPRRNRTMARMFTNLLLGRHPAADECAHLVENERNTVVIEGERLSCAVTQIADSWAKRIECWAAAGSRLERGQRYGMIRMGSQVDVFLPSTSVRPTCAPGDRLVAGETVIARPLPEGKEEALHSSDVRL